MLLPEQHLYGRRHPRARLPTARSSCTFTAIPTNFSGDLSLFMRQIATSSRPLCVCVCVCVCARAAWHGSLSTGLLRRFADFCTHVGGMQTQTGAQPPFLCCQITTMTSCVQCA